MAINKNFVIKNGIQVNDNLFVADPDNNRIGINTALPEYELQVIGGIGVTQARVSGVTTALGDLLVGVAGTALAVRVSAGNSVGIGTNLPEYPLHIRGTSSSGATAGYVYGDLEVTGNASFLGLTFGGANISGITTFTNTTQNTLGDPNTGAVQIDGGLGINKNVTVGGGLSVTGNSYFVGVVTFAAGASGKIQLGDNANDNVEFQADVNSNIIPNTTSTFNLGSSSQEWRDLHLAGNAGIGSLAITGISTFSDNVEISSLTENRIPIVGAGSTIEDDANLTFDGSRLAVGVALTVSGISTFSGNIDADGNLDVDGHTELDDLNVSGVSTFASNLDINADVDISGNAGIGSLVVSGISTFVGLSTFNNGLVVVSGVSTFSGIIDANSDLDVDGHTELDDLNVSGVSTFASNLDINADVDISGNAGIGSLVVSGISTFSNNVEISSLTENRIPIVGAGSTIEDDANLTFDGSQLVVGVGATVGGALTVAGNVDLNADLDVDGRTDLDDLVVTGVSTFVGVSSFTNTTDNTLGDVNTGAIKVDGGMGIAGNVTVGGGLSVTGNSYFVGMVTFAAGTDGNITLGDSNTDNVIFNADVNSNIIPNTNDAYNLGSGTQQWKDFFATGNAGIGSLSVAGVSTFSGDINIGTGATVGFGSTAYFKDNVKAIFGDGEDLKVYHDGSHSYIDDTGTGNLKLRTNNFKISNNDESKTSIIATPPEGVELYYDGTKRFATSGVGVTVYNDLKVEDNTESNSLNIVGVSTFGGIATFTDTTQNPLGSIDTAAVKIAGGLAVAKNVTVGGGLTAANIHTDVITGTGITVSGITTTQILHVGSGGTTLTVDANTATFAIGSATTTVTATMNGGAIPSIGLVIALGS